LGFNKPVRYDKVNCNYKFHMWELMVMKNKINYKYDKFVKISIDDWITYNFEYDILYIKGFTIINKLPKKQDINKFQLLEV